MNIEVLGWLTFVAGMMTFAVVKSLCWLPFSIRAFIWLLGASLMGLAMIYFVNVYDPHLLKEALYIGGISMKITRTAIIVLAVYLICKFGGKGIVIVMRKPSVARTFVACSGRSSLV